MHILCVEDEPLAMEELIFLIHEIEPSYDIYGATNPSEAFIQLLNHHIDLIFLDIQLANANGLDFAKKMQSLEQEPCIVFATAYEQYALEAFQTNAIDYILKPYESSDIRRCLQKAQSYTNLKQEHLNQDTAPIQTNHVKTLSVKNHDIVNVVNIDDIIAIGIEGGTVYVYTSRNKFVSHDTLNHLINMLPSGELFQVHRSFYIRLSAVRQVQPWFNQTLQITLINSLKIPVSRSHVKALKSALHISP